MRTPRRFLIAIMMASLATAGLGIAPALAVVISPDAVDDGTALAPFQFIAEDAPATALDVINNDLGLDGTTSNGLTITAKTNGAHGAVAIDAGLRFVTYTPNANDSGADSFTYTVSDGVNSDTATVWVTVNAVNDAPSFTVGADPSFAEDSGAHTVVGFATANAGGPEESAQTFTYVMESDSNAALFSVAPAISPVGDLTFTPAANANGSATIVAHVVDNGPNGGGDVNFSAPRTFHIVITPVNDAPVAVADGVYQVMQNTATSIAVGAGVLVNDTDIDTLHSALTAVVNVLPTHGTLTLNANGSFTYTPTTGYAGADSFTYHARDGALDSNVVTATINVYVKDTFKPVATAPVQTIRAQTLGSKTVTVYLGWGGTDVGSGISSFEIWRSVNGHAYTKVKTSSAHSMTFTASVGTTYQFRIRAIDKAGNVGNYVYGPTFKAYLFQESAGTYSAPWTLLNSSSYSGGHARGTSQSGRAVSLHTSGRTFAFVSDRAPSRGTADVFVDGVLKAHLTLTSSTTTYRYVAYSITFASSASHTIQVVYTGPQSKRIDVDAFVVLR